MELPDDSERITIVGKTGSGKTTAGLWQLSQRSWHRRPWIILDFKLDEHVARIPRLEHIGVRDKLPKYPGLYAVHLTPADREPMEAMLWAIHQRERIGLFVDESYMIPRDSHPFTAILTQGRSKSIPVIALTQRPVSVSRFVFSEADYVQLYQLSDRRDLKTASEFMSGVPIHIPLPPFHSYWCDHKHNYKAILQPVPTESTILTTFEDRQRPVRRVI